MLGIKLGMILHQKSLIEMNIRDQNLSGKNLRTLKMILFSGENGERLSGLPIVPIIVIKIAKAQNGILMTCENVEETLKMYPRIVIHRSTE